MFREEFIDQTIKVLNEALKLDKLAMQSLFDCRVSVNEALANHPTIQVLGSEMYSLSVLGLINGIIGANEDGCGYVAGFFDNDTGELLNFGRFKK